MNNRKYAVDEIPLNERNMTYWDMFATWFGANANNGTWFIGGVIAAAGFFGGIVAMLIGGILAYIFLSLMGYVGYRTGATTTVLSRGAFGIRGSIVPSLINITLFLGWTAVNTFIAATSLAFIFHSLFRWPLFGQPGGNLGMVVGILIMSFLHILSIISGQRSVQLVERIGVILVIVFVLLEVIVVFKNVSISQLAHYRIPKLQQMPLGVAIDTIAAASLGWVVGGADFTRFTRSKKTAIRAPFWGALLGLMSFTIIGICTTISVALTSGTYDPNNSDPSIIANKLGLGLIAMVVIVLTSMTANAVNIQAGASALNNLVHKLSLNKALVVITLLSMILTFIPLLSGSFLNSFIAFLDYTGMLLGPIIAIMVVDYFILNQDHYTAQALADPQGKLWYQHGFNWIALGTLCLGVLLYLGLKSIPVIRTSVGATFITMGLVAVGYYLLTKGINRKQVN
ncbi:purine-cytosine permease family protein [Fructilactobacillus florum]|uniref:purine-cytosine permease family protein n=1 Tax=Fructilactobacillus florum TaxID=640331 RepID=UPI00028C6264|nr:Cytosine, purine, uracil, thiamine, allantoin permease family protein [Fructilactobacillus florum 2F]